MNLVCDRNNIPHTIHAKLPKLSISQLIPHHNHCETWPLLQFLNKSLPRSANAVHVHIVEAELCDSRNNLGEIEAHLIRLSPIYYFPANPLDTIILSSLQARVKQELVIFPNMPGLTQPFGLASAM